MANVYTTTTDGTTAGQWGYVVETAYDRAVDYYLRDEAQWAQMIDKRPVDQAMPGDVVTFTLHNQLALATSALTETVDPDAVGLPAPTRIQVSLNEYGNAALETLRLSALSFTKPDEEIARLIGFNMIDSVDTIIRTVADGSTNIVYVNGGVVKTTGGALNSVTTTDYLTRTPATVAVKLMRRNKVQPKVGSLMAALIHPDVAFDLQAENSATAWNAPHVYGDGQQDPIYNGTIGDFQGARYVESTRCNTVTNANATPAVVYNTYYLGRQALACAEAISPGVRIGPQTDKLRRFFPIGWYHLGGYALYRPQALTVVKTSSSIASL